MQVRKVIKECYDEVWGILEAHRDALWAGVAALSRNQEMIGGELRDIFDAHPPSQHALDGTPPPSLETMQIFTSKEKGTDIWPYGIDWLDDACPMPYFAQKQIEARAREQEQGRQEALPSA